MKKKGIAIPPKLLALFSSSKNDLLDFYLTLEDKPVSALKNHEILYAFTSSPDLPLKAMSAAQKNDFIKLKELGSGGFSKVYKGVTLFNIIIVRRKDTGRLYAMKSIKKNGAEIYNEITIMRRLEGHPFFPKLFWTFETVSLMLLSLSLHSIRQRNSTS